MLRISKLTDYGIVLLANLVEAGAGQTRNAREMAEVTSLPLPVVSKILKCLAQGGFLTSHRGSKGGYALTRNPTEIRVTEIIEALDGPIALMECSAGPGHCGQEVHCRVRDPWQRINRAVLETLDRVTLAELVRQPAAPVLQVRGAERPREGQHV